MISIHSPPDLANLAHLQNKKNIIVRFVMKDCVWCNQSQPMWNAATEKAVLSSDDAIAEIDSSFVEHFKQSMANRKPFTVTGFPTILIIRGKKVSEHKGRDTESIVSILKQIKKLRKKTRKSKRNGTLKN